MGNGNIPFTWRVCLEWLPQSSPSFWFRDGRDFFKRDQIHPDIPVFPMKNPLIRLVTLNPIKILSHIFYHNVTWQFYRNGSNSNSQIPSQNRSPKGRVSMPQQQSNGQEPFSRRHGVLRRNGQRGILQFLVINHWRFLKTYDFRLMEISWTHIYILYIIIYIYVYIIIYNV